MSKDQPYGHRQISMSVEQIDTNHTASRADGKSLLQENKFIKKQNEVLRKQLENISIRLDGQIKKRLQQQKKKPLSKVQDISQMELQNAYKKCQIYKKEVNYYKKKLESVADVDRFEDYERRISELTKQNQQFKEQLKQIRKINKLQEKGLSEVGAEGYLKIIGQNEKLHEQIRILKKQVDQQRRGKLKVTKTKTQTQNFNTTPSKVQARITQKDLKFQQQIKKRIRTQSNNQNAHQDLNDVLQQKVQKDYAKIKALMSQKSRLREMVDNLKLQLSDKQKQISNLRQKVGTLRKNNQILQLQVNSRVDNHNTIAQEIEGTPKQSKMSKKSRVRLDESKRRVWKRPPVSDGQSQLMDNEHGNRYPRMQQRGSKMENTIKWSHQTLSSKIKELQVLVHETGHIKDIHVKYEKGQPKKYDGGKGKYSILTCNDQQYVKYIKGCFYDDYLQYIVVVTSRKRVQKFGKWENFENSDEGQAFEFEVGQGQFPGALFGENDQIGVRRLGCFIHKEG